jgi:hypothetical protein
VCAHLVSPLSLPFLSLLVHQAAASLAPATLEATVLRSADVTPSMKLSGVVTKVSALSVMTV